MFKTIIFVLFLYFALSLVNWKNKILLAVYVPEENKRWFAIDDFKKRNDATKNLYFGITNKGEECKFWFTDKNTICEIVKDADIKYPKAVEIRIKPLSDPKITVRYIKDKKANWVLAN